MDKLSFQSGQEYNWRYSLTENQVAEAVSDYKAKHKAEFEAKMFAELSDKQKTTEACRIMNAEQLGYSLGIKKFNDFDKNGDLLKQEQQPEPVAVNRPLANFAEDFTHTSLYKNNKLVGSYPNTTAMGVKSSTICAHNWHTHTSAQFTVPTGEHNSLSGAEVNRIENRVTKVFCTHCLEVKDI